MIQIRQASPADTEVLIALSRHTIRASYPPFLGQEAVEAFIGCGAADHYVADHIEDGTVLLIEDEIVGYAVCKGQLIDLILIDPRWQRCGLGTRLLQHCEAVLFQYYDTLTLESFADNHIANNFYRKHGWDNVTRHVDHESGVHKLVFRKSAP